jgi:hypothetical protein
MDFPRTRRRIAERQIESCQRPIEKQREIIAQKKARGLTAVFVFEVARPIHHPV